MANRVAVFRREHFNAAHRLYNSQWSDQQNNDIFGKCSLPHYHGHNYEMEIKVVGVPDENTGFVMDMKKLSDIMKLEILERFDHRNLNMDCPEFKDLIPSAENIALVCWNILREKLPTELKLKVRIWETPRNGVEYDGN